MSSLFAEAMRAAIVTKASGAPPETREASRARKKRESTLCLEYFDYGFECVQPQGHAGDHVAIGDSWELRWRAANL